MQRDLKKGVEILSFTLAELLSPRLEDVYRDL
jgi:hypothetical protein